MHVSNPQHAWFSFLVSLVLHTQIIHVWQRWWSFRPRFTGHDTKETSAFTGDHTSTSISQAGDRASALPQQGAEPQQWQLDVGPAHPAEHRVEGMAGWILEEEGFEGRVGHSLCFEGAQNRNEANKSSNLPIKRGRVFHHYWCCIIISQASRHLLMWQLIVIITVFRQIFRRHHVGASLPFTSERLRQQGSSSSSGLSLECGRLDEVIIPSWISNEQKTNVLSQVPC